jgi:glycosyltransferase involved in cell wall biosynthesis
MRIVLFTDTFAPQVNGVARTLARWLDFAVAAGHQVALVTPRLPNGQPSQAALHVELPSVTVPFYEELRLAIPLDFWSARKLRSFGADLVHVATEFTVGRSGVAWAESEGVPLVTSFHTDFPAYLAGYGAGGLERAAWGYLRRFHEHGRLTFCPSASTLLQLAGHGFHGRLRVWGRGVDANHFTPERRRLELREQLVGPGRLMALYVGRLAPEKRVEVVLDGYAAARAQCEALRLVVTGDGPSAGLLRARAHPDVVFTGTLGGATLADTYAAADLFVFASDTETFGNVVIEALSSGLPVIAAAKGGVLESVIPDCNGLLVEPGNAKSFGEALLALAHDPELRSRLGANARAHAVRRSWYVVFSELFAAYDAVASEVVPQVA